MLDCFGFVLISALIRFFCFVLCLIWGECFIFFVCFVLLLGLLICSVLCMYAYGDGPNSFSFVFSLKMDLFQGECQSVLYFVIYYPWDFSHF